MSQDFIKRESCASCGGENLSLILDLGLMPLANGFLFKDDLNKEEKKFPLTVFFCNNCSLLQIVDVVNPNILFRKEYDYITSASTPLIPHFEEMANDIEQEFITSKNDLFVDIGGNDGTLLNAIKDRCRVVNIDPAQNVVSLSLEKGIETINEFFNFHLAEEVVKKRGNATVVVANNVLAHIANIKDVFEGIKTLIGEKGVLVMEVHWVGNLLTEGGFDQIYHEHLYYYSLISLKNLVNPLGLDIFRVELVPTQGQSMRVFMSHNRKSEKSVIDFLEKEKLIGLNKEETFIKFGKKVEKSKKELKNLLLKLKGDGKVIVTYGAPAKGNTLLNYFGLDGSVIDYAIDTTHFKQGKYTPGTHIQIFSPEKILKVKPDYFLLLAWNYKDAILEKEKHLREKGIKFIIPIPEVLIL